MNARFLLPLLLLAPGCRTFAHNLCAAESEVRTEIDSFRGELEQQLGPILGGTSNLVLYLPFTAAKFALRIGCIGLGEAASALSLPAEAVGLSEPLEHEFPVPLEIDPATLKAPGILPTSTDPIGP